MSSSSPSSPSSLLFYQQIEPNSNNPRNARISHLKRFICVLLSFSIIILCNIVGSGMNYDIGTSSSSSSSSSRLGGLGDSLASATESFWKSNGTAEKEVSFKINQDDDFNDIDGEDEEDTLELEDDYYFDENDSEADDTRTDVPSQPFNTHNPHGKSWCSYATCHNSPLCEPCQRRYLFILATARSGSTTLLRMLNTLPNVRLGGENLNTLFKTYEVIYNLKDDEENHAPKLKDNGEGVPDGPMMHHPIPQGAYACPTQLWIETLNPPPEKVIRQSHLGHRPSVEEYDQYKILGLKSVRFHLGNWTAVQAAEYLRTNFPCARIILNYRSNVESQLESISSRFSASTRTSSELEEFNSFQRDLAHDLGPDMATLLDMNEWKDNVEVINDAVDWLGFQNCRFQELVHENHDGYQRDEEHGVELSKDCWYPYKRVEP